MVIKFLEPSQNQVDRALSMNYDGSYTVVFKKVLLIDYFHFWEIFLNITYDGYFLDSETRQESYNEDEVMKAPTEHYTNGITDYKAESNGGNSHSDYYNYIGQDYADYADGTLDVGASFGFQGIISTPKPCRKKQRVDNSPFMNDAPNDQDFEPCHEEQASVECDEEPSQQSKETLPDLSAIFPMDDIYNIHSNSTMSEKIFDLDDEEFCELIGGCDSDVKMGKMIKSVFENFR